MFFRKTKIAYFKQESTEREKKNSTLMKVSNGMGKLKSEYKTKSCKKASESDSYLDFKYKSKVLYSAISDYYGCPTCEKLICRHYPDIDASEIAEKMDEYRSVMEQEHSNFEDILEVNEMLFQLLESGFYRVSLKRIFPTFGEPKIFSDFNNDQYLKASVDMYYQYMDNGTSYVGSHIAYMLPTQSERELSEDTLKNYRQKNYLGRGLVMGYTGFLGTLLDGHHKATIAYERDEALECLVIEKFHEEYQQIELNQFGFKIQRVPTIDDYCSITQLMENHELYTLESLQAFSEDVVAGKVFLQEDEMDCLLSYYHIFKASRLLELYSLLKQYYYKDIRISYFEKLAKIEDSTLVDEVMLDYLINDEYDNPTVTSICDDYFAKKMI